MRILVVSDTHHDAYSLRNAILQQPKAEVVIHLGDGADEASEMKLNFPEKMFLQVRGNCDWGSQLPVTGQIVLNGTRIFYTHGYSYNVKYGTYNLCAAARAMNAKIVLYGHTHQPEAVYEDGLYVLNPGSLYGSNGTYGIIDLTEQGIVTNVLKLR